MSVSSSRGRSSNPISPERTKVWSEPHNNKLKPVSSSFTNNVPRRVTVPVVYYLSRNGQLEHPHFMEVPLSSPHALFLRDVIGRLNLLRGKAMASQYSWSSKRSYKNGYVWHDLEEDDVIYPVHGGEYVLKGSEILEPSPKSPETLSSSRAKNTPDFLPAGRTTRRRNQSWGAIDLHEYKVYKAESARESDASTQTEDKRRRRSRAASFSIKEETEEEIEKMVEQGCQGVISRQTSSTELSREEISPPPSDSSPETLESLIKADGRLALASSKESIQTVHQESKKVVNPTAGMINPSGKMKAPSVIMSLISCGSLSFRDCGVAAVKDHGMSLMSHYKTTRHPNTDNPTVGGKVGEMILIDNHDNYHDYDDNDGGGDVMEEIEKNAKSKFAEMAMEDKEYFSGSLLMDTTTNKDEYFNSALKLKRSSSYHADRSLHLKMEAKEEVGISAMCIPRRPKTQGKTTRTHQHTSKAKLKSQSNIALTQAGN